MKISILMALIFCILISGISAFAESNDHAPDHISSDLIPDQIESSTDNIVKLEFFVHDINDVPIRDVKIKIESPNIQNIHLITNRGGKAKAQIRYNTYNISIQARNYQKVSRTITISNMSLNPIEFTLIPETGYDLWIFFLPVFLGFLLYMCWLCEASENMKFAFIIFLLSMLIPFLILMSDVSHNMIFYVSLFFSIFSLLIFLFTYLYYSKKSQITQKWGSSSKLIFEVFGMIKVFLIILAILSWPSIVCYFECENIETVVISDLNFLEFPVYIVVGVTIGVLSYLMITIKQTFSQLLPINKKRSILWECTRRVLIAPYIAIVGVYLIFDFKNPEFIGTISNSIGNIGEKGMDTTLDTPNAHFIFLFSIFAGMFTNTVEEFVYNKVRSVISLGKSESDENNKYDIKMSGFVELGMNEDLIYLLYYKANISTMQSLANAHARDVFDQLDHKFSESEIQYYIYRAQDILKKKTRYN